MKMDDITRNDNVQDPRLLVKALTQHIDNERLNDEKFRDFVRNVLPMYQEHRPVHDIEIKAPSGF